jgi:hypothetical protein
MTTLQYPLDLTGLAVTNLVPDEQHAVTDANFRDYHFVVPKFAPFFMDNLVIKHHLLDEVRILTEEVDYYPALQFIGAIREIGKPVYGAVTLNNTITAGIISITYQTIGGPWTADREYVLDRLAEKIYNPRLTIWDNVTDKTNQFPPIDHQQPYGDIYGQKELVEAIVAMGENIASSRDQSGMAKHLFSRSNPHLVTKQQVGLGQVEDLPLASIEEALAGVDAGGYITPLTLRAAIDGMATDPRNAATDEEVMSRALVDKFVSLRQVLSLIRLFNMPMPMQYNMTTPSTLVNEGETIVFTVNSMIVPDGTQLFWTVSHDGTDGRDMSPIQGSVTLFANTGTFSVTPILDSSPEPWESFTVNLRTGGYRGPIVVTSAIITIGNVTPSCTFTTSTLGTTFKEKDVIDVTVDTTGLMDATVIFWTLEHLETKPLYFAQTSGSLQINNNQGHLSFTLNDHLPNETDQLFRIVLRLDSITGPIVDVSPMLTVVTSITILELINMPFLFTPYIPPSARSLYITAALS